MKVSAAFVALSLGSCSLAATLASRAACTTAVRLTGNAFTNRTLKAHSIYANEVKAAVAALSDTSLATKAAKLASVGTFFWL
jgi:cellulose 1,4-beta-cellobiosidase